MFSLLDEIVTRSAKQNGTKPGGDIVTMLLKKRFLSSPFAFGMTLSHYLELQGRAGAQRRRLRRHLRRGPVRRRGGPVGARRSRAAA